MQYQTELPGTDYILVISIIATSLYWAEMQSQASLYTFILLLKLPRVAL